MAIRPGEGSKVEGTERASWWKRLLQIVGWYQDPVLGVVGLTFFAFLALVGLAIIAALGYGGYQVALVYPLQLVLVVGGAAALSALIVTLRRRCPGCRRWLALKVESREVDHVPGTATVNDSFGRSVTVAADRTIHITHLRCRYCGHGVTRRW